MLNIINNNPDFIDLLDEEDKENFNLKRNKENFSPITIYKIDGSRLKDYKQDLYNFTTQYESYKDIKKEGDLNILFNHINSYQQNIPEDQRLTIQELETYLHLRDYKLNKEELNALMDSKEIIDYILSNEFANEYQRVLNMHIKENATRYFAKENIYELQSVIGDNFLSKEGHRFIKESLKNPKFIILANLYKITDSKLHDKPFDLLEFAKNKTVVRDTNKAFANMIKKL